MPKRGMKKPKKGSIFEKPKSDDEAAADEPDELLEGDEHEGTHLEHRMKVSVGEKEEDVYTEEGREELEEEDAVAPWEEGFAAGAEGPEAPVCANCEKVLGDREENVIEREIKGKLLLFCSEKCAMAGMKGKGK